MTIMDQFGWCCLAWSTLGAIIVAIFWGPFIREMNRVPRSWYEWWGIYFLTLVVWPLFLQYALKEHKE